MLWYLWLVLVAIGFLAIVYSKANKYYFMVFVGWAMIFTLSFALLPTGEGLQYKIGSNTTTNDYLFLNYTYGNNFTGYHWDYSSGSAPSCTNPNDPLCVYLFHQQENSTYIGSTVDVYASYTSLFFGTWFLIVSALMFVLEIINFRSVNVLR